MDLGPPTINLRWYYLEILNLITLVKTLFPNKFTCTSVGPEGGVGCEKSFLEPIPNCVWRLSIWSNNSKTPAGCLLNSDIIYPETVSYCTGKRLNLIRLPPTSEANEKCTLIILFFWPINYRLGVLKIPSSSIQFRHQLQIQVVTCTSD